MVKNTAKYITSIGIDPGWKNLGFAIVQKDRETKELIKECSTVFDPSSFSTISKFVDTLDEFIVDDFNIPLVDYVTIERFVPYNGIFTQDTENITLVIGALLYYFGEFRSWYVDPKLVRAIEWKTKLVKELFKKKGFSNPSTTLDKKFSIAAAKACLDKNTEFETDHEADAICLASLPFYLPD